MSNIITEGCELASIVLYEPGDGREPAWPDVKLCISSEDGSFLGLVAHEGTPTTDGRVLAPGAVGLSRMPVPLIRYLPSESDHQRAEEVGVARTAFRVENSLHVFGYLGPSAIGLHGDYGCGIEIITNETDL